MQILLITGYQLKSQRRISLSIKSHRTVSPPQIEKNVQMYNNKIYFEITFLEQISDVLVAVYPVRMKYNYISKKIVLSNILYLY